MGARRLFFGFFDELTDRFGTHYAGKLDALETATETRINKELEGLDPAQLAELTKSTREQRKLISTGAAYGNEVVSTSKQILAFGAAGIGLTAAFSKDLATLPTPLLKLIGVAAIFYLNLSILALYTLFCFLWQTRFRYPFLYFSRIGNAVPYFYYRAISTETPRTVFQTAAEKMIGASHYANDLVDFVRYLRPPTKDSDGGGAEGTAALDCARKQARDELQQYFLHLSYQGYVNQYEVRMNNQFLYGLIASVAAALALAVYAYWPR